MPAPKSRRVPEKLRDMPGLSLDNVKLSANDSEPEVLEADRKRGRADNEQR
jgi:hypothetical protein